MDNTLKPCTCCLLFETLFPSDHEDIGRIQAKLLNLVTNGYCEHVGDAICEELKKLEGSEETFINVEEHGQHYILNICNKETDILVGCGGIGTLHLLVLLNLTHCVRFMLKSPLTPIINTAYHNVLPFQIATMHKNRSMVKFLFKFTLNPYNLNFDDKLIEQYFSYIILENLTNNFVKSPNCVLRTLRMLLCIVLRMLNCGERAHRRTLIKILERGWHFTKEFPYVGCLDRLLRPAEKEITTFMTNGNEEIAMLFISSRLESTLALISFAVRLSK